MNSQLAKIGAFGAAGVVGIVVVASLVNVSETPNAVTPGTSAASVSTAVTSAPTGSAMATPNTGSYIIGAQGTTKASIFYVPIPDFDGVVTGGAIVDGNATINFTDPQMNQSSSLQLTNVQVGESGITGQLVTSCGSSGLFSMDCPATSPITLSHPFFGGSSYSGSTSFWASTEVSVDGKSIKASILEGVSLDGLQITPSTPEAAQAQLHAKQHGKSFNLADELFAYSKKHPEVTASPSPSPTS